MEKKNVRIPQQQRSIQKKRRIMDAAYRTFTKKGYFSTSTADIAKEADLSVGSIYAYFADKKDILLSCMEQSANDLHEHIRTELNRIPEDYDIYETTKKVLQITITFHKRQSLLYHNEITSLQYRDTDVANFFVQIQDRMAKMVTKIVEAHGYTFPQPREQFFLLFRMFDTLQDELAFNQRPDLDHTILLDEAVQLIVSMITRVKKDNQ
ncbi:TetR/AcrR family transcriptional regulator [Sporolactobacillus laevolacticus]|uniref:AcrR family transcriptional regulator n=1 Tax=Sporolactobacillus laevolacticus DSM 442 TaxID=1395513 RepID=V6J3R2_9BACL|nr:TetR/AcrR family transcriptional regulator [Sporolactobacillus laevolacticus]EST11349.1 AcrR family transcriptional regulator [Sporolactobacillus laevolacticus DSM 442]